MSERVYNVGGAIRHHTQKLIDGVAYKRSHDDKREREADRFQNERICCSDHGQVSSVVWQRTEDAIWQTWFDGS